MVPFNEADTRAKLIDPKIREAGWGESQIEREHFVVRGKAFTAGRIYLVGEQSRRRPPRRADYLFRLHNALPIAILEAKDETHTVDAGLEQAKGYAIGLGLPFAYSSNGRGFVEFDFFQNRPPAYQYSLGQGIDDGFLATYKVHKVRTESIYIDVLAEVLSQPKADQFDLLAHIAFDKPIRTRGERADAFLNYERRFVQGHDPKAREVILALLDKYRLSGVNEITSPDVFRLSPFREMGQAPGVIERFGGAESLRETLAEMQQRLYRKETA